MLPQGHPFLGSCPRLCLALSTVGPPSGFLSCSGSSLDSVLDLLLPSTSPGLSCYPPNQVVLEGPFQRLVTVFLGIWWMSDKVLVERSALQAIFERLEEVRDELASLQSSILEAVGGWRVAAAEEPAILIPHNIRVDVYHKLLFCGADTGPPELPEACYHVCKHLERGSSRAERAFRAGFWSKSAIDCHVPYTPEKPLPGVEPSQWLIIREDHSLIPCRVYTEGEAVQIIGKSDNVICEKFETLAEVNLYCLGASIKVPKLVSWKSQ